MRIIGDQTGPIESPSEVTCDHRKGLLGGIRCHCHCPNVLNKNMASCQLQLVFTFQIRNGAILKSYRPVRYNIQPRSSCRNQKHIGLTGNFLPALVPPGPVFLQKAGRQRQFLTQIRNPVLANMSNWGSFFQESCRERY